MNIMKRSKNWGLFLSFLILLAGFGAGLNAAADDAFVDEEEVSLDVSDDSASDDSADVAPVSHVASVPVATVAKRSSASVKPAHQQKRTKRVSAEKHPKKHKKHHGKAHHPKKPRHASEKKLQREEAARKAQGLRYQGKGHLQTHWGQGKHEEKGHEGRDRHVGPEKDFEEEDFGEDRHGREEGHNVAHVGLVMKIKFMSIWALSMSMDLLVMAQNMKNGIMKIRLMSIWALSMNMTEVVSM